MSIDQAFYDYLASQGVFYIDSREYDPRSQTPFNVVLDGSKTEQRIPLRLVRCPMNLNTDIFELIF